MKIDDAKFSGMQLSRDKSIGLVVGTKRGTLEMSTDPHDPGAKDGNEFLDTSCESVESLLVSSENCKTLTRLKP